jgi:phage shock protein C
VPSFIKNEEKMIDKKKRLHRSKSDRFISGVCGGIAEYFGIDSNVVRIIFVILSFTGGMGIVLYITGLIILTENPADAGTSAKKMNSSLIVGLALIVIGAIFLLREVGMFHYFNLFRFSWSTVWGLLLIGIGVVLLFQARNQAAHSGETEASPSESEKKIFRSRNDKMLAGVCGGIGNYFQVDPSFIRIGWVLATFFSFGIGILVYILLIIVFPEEPTGEPD